MESISQNHNGDCFQDKPLSIIESGSQGIGNLFSELRHYRELLVFLTWRDILIRYKQTVLGAIWEIVKPLTMMLIFSLFIGFLLKIPSDDMPAPLFFYSGSVLWTFFSACLMSASTSIVNSANLVTKVYFPRIIVPIASVVSGIFDFVIALTVVILMLIYYGIFPGFAALGLVLVVAEVVLLAIGIGLWFSAILVRFRDVQNVLPLMTTAWMFATPVFYPISIIPSDWIWLYSLNPMVGALSLFRWSITGNVNISFQVIFPGLLLALLSVILGLISFQKRERYFSDWL